MKLELWLYRTYKPGGVNGELCKEGKLLCYTIELPWLNNQAKCSCIPEGSYVLKKRWSPKHQWHIEVSGVPHRSFILIHPANNAKKELQGCIAPVSHLNGEGQGIMSRVAFEQLKKIVFNAMEKEPVILVIVSKQRQV